MIKPKLPLLRFEPTGSKSRLNNLISKFEALGAINRPSDTIGLHKHMEMSPTCVVDGIITDHPLRKLSTVIFSPRPPSTGRYENVFLEDESPVEKDDVFTCPPYNSVGSVKITKMERLKSTSSPPNTTSFPAEDASRDSNILSRVECMVQTPFRRDESVNKFRRNSIKDRIRFYDGGSDLPNPSCLSQPLIRGRAIAYYYLGMPVPKVASKIPSLLYQDYAVPVTPGSVKKKDSRSSSKDFTSEKLNSRPPLQRNSQLSQTKLETHPHSKKHTSVSDRPPPAPFYSTSSVSKSLNFQTPGPTPKTPITGPGSDQRSDFSPLRERRLTRLSIPRKSPGSLPRPTEKVTSEGRGKGHISRPSIERRQPPQGWKQVGEKISELYREKSQNRNSMHSRHHTLGPSRVSLPDLTQEKSICPPKCNTQVDGPAMSRKPSRISGLAKVFDDGIPDTKLSSSSLSTPLESFEVRPLKNKGIEDPSESLAFGTHLTTKEMDLSVILERIEPSSSTSMIENTQPLPLDAEAQESVQDENWNLSLPIQDSLPQISSPPTVEDHRLFRGENGLISPLMPYVPVQLLIPPSIEIQTTVREEVYPFTPLTPAIDTIIMKDPNDPDRTLTPPLPEDARLWVPRKRKATAEAATTLQVDIPQVATLLSPVDEVKPLRLPRERPSQIPRATKLANDDRSIPSSPQRPRVKSKAIQDRIKLFERKVSEVVEKPAGSLLKGSLKSRINVVPNLRLKKISKNTEKLNTDLSIRRVLSADTINAIVAGFQAMEATTTGEKGITGKAKALLETPNDTPETIERKQRELDGASERKSQLDMVIKEAECEMVSPKPVRLSEKNRMMKLCRGKVDKTSRNKKH